MSANGSLERRVAEHYRNEPPLRVPDRVLLAALATIQATPQRRGLLAPWRFSTMNTYAKVTAAAVAAIAVGAIGLALVGNTSLQPAPKSLSWTPERYAEDWPAARRVEPFGGGPDVLLVRGDNAHWDASEGAWEGLEYADIVGDAGSGAYAWIDIREVRGPGAGIASYTIELAGGVPLPPTDPRSRWIAYGIVIDTDADGIADERVGIDNMPDGAHRAWSTDLLTGRTKWKAGPGYGFVYDDGVARGSLGLDTWYPSAMEEIDNAVLRYSGGSGRFYGWASMIEDGRVVATDYAPNIGWLVEPQDPGLPLVGTTWIVEREIPSRSLTVVMWLIFTPDGHLAVELCQRGDATVQVTQDTMRLTDFELTGDPCSAEVTEMESEILAVLTADEVSYSVDAGILELRAGSTVLRFIGSPDPPPGS